MKKLKEEGLDGSRYTCDLSVSKCEFGYIYIENMSKSKFIANLIFDKIKGFEIAFPTEEVEN